MDALAVAFDEDQKQSCEQSKGCSSRKGPPCSIRAGRTAGGRGEGRVLATSWLEVDLITGYEQYARLQYCRPPFLTAAQRPCSC